MRVLRVADICVFQTFFAHVGMTDACSQYEGSNAMEVKKTLKLLDKISNAFS